MVSLFKIQLLHLNCRPGTSAVFNSQSFSLFLPCFLLLSTVLSNKGKNAKNVCLKKTITTDATVWDLLICSHGIPVTTKRRKH